MRDNAVQPDRVRVDPAASELEHDPRRHRAARTSVIDSLTSSSLRPTATTATATSAPPKAWIASRRDEVRDLDRLVGGDVRGGAGVRAEKP
jgi:hypothetical protein